jgi:hypothetical protein
MTFGSEGAMAIAPIDPVDCSSKSGVQLEPKSVERQTPPLSNVM